ncbi:hypothetical protein C0995_005061 [Termitomyces sp. Mi166|nr:hypothetical protein C0995_005061 [Termitomyces sp. Mi166\
MAPTTSEHREHRRERDRERDRERERERERSHHHHRTISSSTLLLVLSLVLAVLAVMLSLPSAGVPSDAGVDSAKSGVLGYLTPKRTQALIAREGAVAQREAEVARREAELLAGAPGGVLPSPCPVCVPTTVIETVAGPAQTVIKEVVKEDSLTPPGWVGTRTEELLDRELKIAERERDISKREEAVNRREHDASRRESWIMEQLHDLGNDNPQTVEDEYVYEPVGTKRKAKSYHELPPYVLSEIAYETETKTVVQTQTVTVPPPANTRLAANPKPEGVTSLSTPSSPKTTAVEIVPEEDEDDYRATRTVVRGPRATRRPPSRWFGGW